MIIKETAMIFKEDARAISDARKSAYIKEKALEYMPLCFDAIREVANNMQYDASVHVEGVQFIPDIIYELAKVLIEVGYLVTMIGGRGNSKFIRIYWRKLTEYEMKGQI